MAVFTKINDNELVEFVSEYNIGTVISYTGIAEGIENSNFHLITSSGSYILTLYEKRINLKELPFFLNLMMHLRECGVPCPKPIQARNGKMLRKLSGRPAAIVSFLRGKGLQIISPDHCGQLGVALASLHIAGKSFNRVRKNDLSIKNWRLIANSIEDKIDLIVPGLRRELFLELLVLEKNWPNDLPVGIIHGDLFPDNVLFERSKLSGLIDFYFSCTDSYAYDIAVCVNSWCFGAYNKFNFDKSKSLLDKYRSMRELSNSELESLPILMRGSAMRFLITRLYDWVNTPNDALVTPKDPIEYWEKLCFHRKVSQAEEYGTGT